MSRKGKRRKSSATGPRRSLSTISSPAGRRRHNDSPASEGIIANRAGLKIVQIIETNEKYGFAISKTKPDLRAAVNKALTDMMKDGTFTSIYKTWFKTDPPFALPPE